jgi:serine/threonine protein phosphatase PrpC
MLQGHNLIIGNLGDSRAVLGTRDENNQLVSVQLTVDLKPDIPSKHVFSFFCPLLYC